MSDKTKETESQLGLQAQLAELERLYNTAPIGLCLLDTDLRYVNINQVLADFNGCPVSEHIGRTPQEIIPHVFPFVEPFFRQVLETGAPYRGIELRSATQGEPDRERDWLIDLYDYRSSDGVMQGVSVVLQDITERKEIEEILSYSEERLKIVFEYAPDAYYLSDLKGVFVDGNRAAEELIGYKREELIGRNFLTLNLLPPQQIPKAMALLARNALRKSTGPDEFILKRKDGGRVPVEIRTHPVKIRGQALVLGIARDITERKRAEMALMEREERLRTVMEKMPEGVAVTVEGGIVYANPVLAEMVGYTLEEIQGGTPGAFIHPKDRERAAARIRDLVEGGAEYASEYRLLTKDGAVVPVEIFSRCLHFEGKPGILSVIRDLTERKQAEQVLGEREEQYRRMFESVVDMVFVVNLDGTIGDANPATCAAHGYTREEMQRLSITDVIAPDYHHLFASAVEAMEAGESFLVEAAHRRRDGSRFAVEIRVSPFRLKEMSCMLAVVRDITERKRARDQIIQLNVDLRHRAEALEAANEELEAFAYSVSHDLRAPLRAIDGFAEILADDYAESLPQQAHAYLQTIQQNAQQMDRLIEDLLSFSRLGRQPLKTERVDVAALTREVLSSLLSTHDEAPRVETAIGELPPCQADPALLRQVLTNLLSNALKFSRARQVPHIEVGAIQQADETLYYVRDNGVGFDMVYADKLFGVFERLHLVDEYEGTGVGLAVGKRIIDRHGGRIWAEAALDEGATFYFSLG